MARTRLVGMLDSHFVLFEMLRVEGLCSFPRYESPDRDLIKDTIRLARRISLDGWCPVDQMARAILGAAI